MISEFKKLVLVKLNRIIYKLDTFENRFDKFEAEKAQYSKPACIIQESSIQFPISTLPQLTLFEEQLQDMKFKEDVV